MKQDSFGFDGKVSRDVLPTGQTFVDEVDMQPYDPNSIDEKKEGESETDGEEKSENSSDDSDSSSDSSDDDEKDDVTGDVNYVGDDVTGDVDDDGDKGIVAMESERNLRESSSKSRATKSSISIARSKSSEGRATSSIAVDGAEERPKAKKSWWKPVFFLQYFKPPSEDSKPSISPDSSNFLSRSSSKTSVPNVSYSETTPDRPRTATSEKQSVAVLDVEDTSSEEESGEESRVESDVEDGGSERATSNTKDKKESELNKIFDVGI